MTLALKHKKRSLELAELLDTPVCVFKSFSYPQNRDNAFLRWTAYPGNKLKFAQEDIGDALNVLQNMELFMIEKYDRILDNNITLNENDQKQIDRLLHECLSITGDILNKEYDEELIDVIEELADKISKIRCFVNPVYKQICDDVEKAISESEEDICHTY